MLKSFYVLFAHSIYIKKFITIRPLFILKNREQWCPDNAPALYISLFVCSNLAGCLVHKDFHHLFSSPEINSNKSRWTWHIEWMEKNRTHNFGLETPMKKCDGFQSAEGRTLLKRIGKKQRFECLCVLCFSGSRQQPVTWIF
jgi:hypothetical protein